MSTEPPAVALRCRGLVKRYGSLVAVDGLDLEVPVGECFGLLGPNGAGKTTTVEILEGLIPPDAGEVEVLGARWGRDDRALRQRLGIHLQETQLNEKLTVTETVRLFRSFYDDGPTVNEAIGLVELDAKRSSLVGKLSGGQKQRLALACALVNRPALLFLDEPTTGLDPQARRQVWRLLERFRAGGGTILITTHYMDEAEALCDRVAIVDRGRIIAMGTPLSLVATLGADHVVEFALAGAEPPGLFARLPLLPGVRGVSRNEDRTCLRVAEVHEALPALVAELEARGAHLSFLATHHATLEDVFVAKTGRHLRDA